MKIILKKSIFDGKKRSKSGTILDLVEDRAQSLVSRGFADIIPEKKEAEVQKITEKNSLGYYEKNDKIEQEEFDDLNLSNPIEKKKRK